jgi:dsRNA-specific ribonuclease
MPRAGKPGVTSDDRTTRIALAESILGHTFHDKDLVQRALTHPSAVEGRDPDAYYERLEFLGDSIVGFLIAEELYARFPSMDEGGLTRIRVSVVSRTALGLVAAKLGLADAIVVGPSEEPGEGVLRARWATSTRHSSRHSTSTRGCPKPEDGCLLRSDR